MTDLRRVVLDVLKPHDPALPTFSRRLADAPSVEAATVSVVEIDEEVQNVRVAIEGDPLDYQAVEAAIDQTGATVHSIDEATAGRPVVDEPPPRDE